MINQLTPEQEAYLPVFREECRQKALLTESIDKEKAVVAVNNLYTINGFEKPVIIFGRSPAECLEYYNAVRYILKQEIDIEICEENKDEMLYMAKQDENYKKDFRVPSMWFLGAWDYYWIGFYMFAQHIGVKFNNQERLNYYKDYIDNAGIMYAYENIAFVSDRPEEFHFNKEQLLHNEHGPSIKFRDGYSVYSWNGTKIPEKWITEGVDVTTALTWENAEERRCACEIIGWAKVLEDPSLNPKIIDEDLPHIGTLIQVDLPEAPEQWILKYKCGTHRWLAEIVNDKSYNTALKANAGGNGWRGEGDPMSFIPFIRT